MSEIADIEQVNYCNDFKANNTNLQVDIKYYLLCPKRSICPPLIDNPSDRHNNNNIC